jgi:serine/threonine protein kinase
MAAPTKLGKYEIKGELGTGAMGVVYRAEDSRLGRLVALKVMSPSVASNPDLVKRFYREAQAAGQLHHPNIVTIYDIDEVDGLPFIAMEFLEGEDLDKVITAGKEMPVVKKLDIIVQACKGLHHAHQRGIVHRDVKPGNIVLLNDGMVKIVDFGIAHLGATSMTQTGMVLGTVMYMAPEQISGQRVDARADIFSVGVILYELLTFQTPFSGHDVPSVLYKILNEPPEPLSDHVRNCPPQLETILKRALEKERTKRYQTAEDMAFDLQRVADSMRRDMVEVYLKQGQRFKDEHNYTLAKDSFRKVLEIDSAHDLAKTLLDQVQEQIASRQLAQKIEQLIRHAKENLQAEEYDEAVAELDEILQLEPGHEEANQYRQMAIDRRERKQKTARHMERAEKFATDADFQAAKTEIEAVLALDPEHAGALKMMDWVTRELTEQVRTRQVRQFTENARAQMAEKNFAKAVEWLEKARALDPINIEIDSLMRLVRSSQEKDSRRQLLDQRLATIEEALNREQFDEALALADQALQDFAEDPRVLKLRTQAARQAETQKKRTFIEEQLHAAREFLQKNEYSSALAILERGRQSYPDDARLGSFIKTVQEAQRTASLESQRADALRQAKELIRAKDFAQAIDLLEQTMTSAGQTAELIEFLQFARDQQAEQKRLGQIQEVLTRAQGLLRDENFEEAIYLLERSQKQFATKDFDVLLATAREQFQKFAERREREEKARRELLDRRVTAIEEALSREQFDRALTLADQVLQDFAEDPRALKLRTQAARGAEAQKKRLFIEEQLRAARDLIQKNEFQEALAVLEHGLETYPGETRLATFVKTVQEARDVANRDALVKDAARQAQEMIRAKDFAGAISLLEKTLASAGQSGELAEFLKFARDQQAEQKRREEVRQVLSRAQSFLNEENYEGAIHVLERGQKELPANEIAALLASAQDQLKEVERRREEAIDRAHKVLQGGDPARAVAALEAAPKSFFKNEKFQRTYAQAREALSRFSAIQSATEQIEKCLRDEDLVQAQNLVQHYLKAFPGEAKLLACQKRLGEEESRVRRRLWNKILDDAMVNVGRLQYKEAVELLNSVDWSSGDAPELAEKAKSLLEDANKRLKEMALQQTVIRAPSPPPQGSDAVGLLSAQERLREALKAGGQKRELGATRVSPVPGAPTPAVRGAVPAVTPAVAPPRPVAPPKRTPVALYAGIGVLVIALAGFAAWRFMKTGTGGGVGYVQLSSTPWAEIQSVETDSGKPVDVKGQTPLQVALPPGKYVVSLASNGHVEKVPFSVEAGKPNEVNFKFPDFKVDSVVNELVSKY